MEYVVLGRTGLQVNKNGFGALPIQRISKEKAGKLLKKAFENGINYFDTARAYSDSEEKMGAALAAVRDQVIISTKTAAQDAKEFWKDLEESLSKLQTDYIDLYQFHNPAFCPKPGDGTGLYEAALEAKEQGKSVISVLQITELQWQKNRFYPVFMRHYSSRFLIWHQRRKRSL